MDDAKFDQVSRSLAASSTRRQTLSVVGGGLAGGLLAAVGLADVGAKRKGSGNGNGNGNGKGNGRKKKNPLRNIPITGVNESGQTVFTGKFSVKRFDAANGGIDAVGTLIGNVSGGGGVNQLTRIPVSALNGVPIGAVSLQSRVRPQAPCRILDLVLGPLDLNLLGLRVQLNQVVLNITAIPGGGLLGDLLCAVANLLNPLGSLIRIVNLLNRILDALESGLR